MLVGNSMGAYASLLTSAEHPEVSRGLVLVNGAGKFEEVKAAVEGIAEAGGQSQTAKEALQDVSSPLFYCNLMVAIRHSICSDFGIRSQF